MTRINRNMSIAGGAIPAQRVAVITFTRRSTLLNIGSANSNETFLITDPSNVDFAHIGTSVNLPFWDSYQQQYRQFRVLGARASCSFSNNEPGGALVSLTPVNKSVAQNDASYDVLLDQPNTRRKYLGPLTGNGIGTLGG